MSLFDPTVEDEVDYSDGTITPPDSGQSFTDVTNDPPVEPTITTPAAFESPTVRQIHTAEHHFPAPDEFLDELGEDLVHTGRLATDTLTVESQLPVTTNEAQPSPYPEADDTVMSNADDDDDPRWIGLFVEKKEDLDTDPGTQQQLDKVAEEEQEDFDTDSETQQQLDKVAEEEQEDLVWDDDTRQQLDKVVGEDAVLRRMCKELPEGAYFEPDVHTQQHSNQPQTTAPTMQADPGPSEEQMTGPQGDGIPHDHIQQDQTIGTVEEEAQDYTQLYDEPVSRGYPSREPSSEIEMTEAEPGLSAPRPEQSETVAGEEQQTIGQDVQETSTGGSADVVERLQQELEEVRRQLDLANQTIAEKDSATKQKDECTEEKEEPPEVALDPAKDLQQRLEAEERARKESEKLLEESEEEVDAKMNQLKKERKERRKAERMVEELQTENESLTARLELKVKEVSKTREEKSGLQAQLDTAQKNEQTAEDLRQEHSALQAEVKQLRPGKSVLEQKVRDLKAANQKLQDEHKKYQTAATKTSSDQKARVNTLSAEVHLLRHERDTSVAVIALKKEQDTNASLRSELEIVRSEMATLESRRRKETKNLNSRLEAAQAATASFEAELRRVGRMADEAEVRGRSLPEPSSSSSGSLRSASPYRYRQSKYLVRRPELQQRSEYVAERERLLEARNAESSRFRELMLQKEEDWELRFGLVRRGEAEESLFAGVHQQQQTAY